MNYLFVLETTNRYRNLFIVVRHIAWSNQIKSLNHLNHIIILSTYYIYSQNALLGS